MSEPGCTLVACVSSSSFVAATGPRKTASLVAESIVGLIRIHRYELRDQRP